MTKGKRTKG